MAKEINKKKKKVKTKYDIAYICMLIVAGLIIVGTGTYAYYRSTMTGTTSGTIAKWSFTANNQVSNISLNYDGLYPGKSDVKYVELSAENSDLPVTFMFVLDFPNIMDANGQVAEYSDVLEMTSLYGLTFFDNAYEHGPIADNIVGWFGIIMPGEKITIPIYYNWPYESTDDEHQTIADGRLLTNGLTIMGRQLDISTLDNFDTSFNQFLEDFNVECSMGDYKYSNKFGYPCDTTFLMPDENVMQAGNVKNYELGDVLLQFLSNLFHPFPLHCWFSPY